MKILFFYPKISKYGVCNAAVNIINFLCENGYSVTLATDKNTENAILKRFDVRIYIEIRKDDEDKLAFAKRLLRSEYTHHIGVQTHNAYWLVLAKIFRLDWRKKIISWEHSSPVTSLIKEYSRSWMLHLGGKLFFAFFIDAFFCVSSGGLRELNRKLLVSKKKLYNTPNIVFDVLAEPVKLNIKQKGSKFIFLSVGRLTFEKGIDVVLSALERIDGVDWEYWLVGDGELRTSLEDRCNKSAFLKGKVIFWGWSESPNNFMQQADVMILASYYEGLPTVLVEASINELPIISSNCITGPDEIVCHGENGYLFDVGSAEDLTIKINLFLRNKAFLKNSKVYVKKFSQPIAGHEFLRALRQVR